jgi:hypothetical protein
MFDSLIEKKGWGEPSPIHRLAGVRGRQAETDPIEHQIQLSTDELDRDDTNDRNQRGEQAVLDHRHAFFFAHEALDTIHHDLLLLR